MQYRIRNVNGDYLNLFDLSLNLSIPNTTIRFLSSISAYKISDKIAARYNGYGGVVKGDGKFADRDLNLKFSISTKNVKRKVSGNWVLDGQLEHRKILNYIARFLRPEMRDFWLENINYNIETRINHEGLRPKTTEGLEYIVSEYDMPLAMVDGLWLGQEITQVAVTDYTSSFAIQIDTDIENYPVYPFDAFPVIEITTAHSNSDFTIINTTNKYSIRVQENVFTTGHTITLDSVKGKAYFNSSEKMKMITDGYFLYLSPGINNFEYSGLAPCVLTIKYRPRYVH